MKLSGGHSDGEKCGKVNKPSSAESIRLLGSRFVEDYLIKRVLPKSATLLPLSPPLSLRLLLLVLDSNRQTNDPIWPTRPFSFHAVARSTSTFNQQLSGSPHFISSHVCVGIFATFSKHSFCFSTIHPLYDSATEFISLPLGSIRLIIIRITRRP